MLIPKTIHYCWFGGKEIPDEYKGYINEWESLHPGWEIKRWDETNVPSDLPYVQNALQHEKWANLSNFIRYYTLLNYGGIYMDTDVKVIKPLDSLLEHECFMGFEEGNSNSDVFWVNNAICGAVVNNSFIELCYQYLLTNFDGLEEANLSGPQLVTKLLKTKYGLTTYGLQTLNGVTLYPTSYFYPIHYSEVYKLSDLWNNIDETTIAVHIWSRSWLTQAQLLMMYDDLQFRFRQELEQIQRLNAQIQDLQNKEIIQLKEFQNREIIQLQEYQNKETALNARIDFLIANETLLHNTVELLHNTVDQKNAQLKEQAFFYEDIKAELQKSNQLLEQYITSSLQQSQTSSKEIQSLQQRINEYEKQINWYQLTYEKRTLPGIIKDRFIKLLNLKHG